MYFKGTPVTFAVSSSDLTPGNRRSHSDEYLDFFVLTPVSVLNGRYAFAVFQWSRERLVISRRLCVLRRSDNPL